VNERTINPPATVDFVAPTQQELEAKALKFFKECKPKQYRQMQKDGDLKEVCQLRAKATRRYALSLMENGVWETEAWNRAIRTKILESDSD